MPKMTKVNHARQARILAELDCARRAVYAAAPTRDVPLSECLTLATPAVVETYKAALAALNEFERLMIAQGRAYRGFYGTFTAY